jgi:hypothetical protein
VRILVLTDQKLQGELLQHIIAGDVECVMGQGGEDGVLVWTASE